MDAFVFTGGSVKRGVVIRTQAQGFKFVFWQIPLARCDKCDKWARVLPIELLPRKIYGVQVIQTAVCRYLFLTNSLRKAAGEVVVTTPITLHHSTLWH